MFIWSHTQRASDTLSGLQPRCKQYIINLPENIVNRNFLIHRIDLMGDIETPYAFTKPLIQIALYKNFNPTNFAMNLYTGYPSTLDSPNDFFANLAFIQNNFNQTGTERLSTFKESFFHSGHLQKLIMGDQLSLGVTIQNMDVDTQTIYVNTLSQIHLEEI